MINTLVEKDGLIFCLTKSEYLDWVLNIEKNNSDFVFVWPKERHIEAINRVDEVHISIVNATNGALTGYILLAGVGGEDRSLELRRMAIADKGRGYGRTSIKFVKEYCFEVLKCHRLWLDAFTDNERGINLYLSEGFTHEGIMRECKLRGEEYRSMVLMSMLENEYKKD